MRRLALMGSLACLTAGCGSSDPLLEAAPAQETPLTQQAPFTPHSIIFDMYTGGIRSIVIAFSDRTTACQDMRAHRNPPGSKRMTLVLKNSAYNIPMNTNYLVYARKGRIPGWGQPSMEGQVDTVDADCAYSKQEFVDGNILVESIDSGSATAVISYNLVLEDESRWQGRWLIKHCGGINTAASLARTDWACEPAG